MKPQDEHALRDWFWIAVSLGLIVGSVLGIVILLAVGWRA